MDYPIGGQRALCASLVQLMQKRRPHGFGLGQSECNLSHDGSPPPMAGQWFWGVWSSNMKADAGTHFRTDPVVTVTLSARTGDIAYDRLGSEFVYSKNGMMDRLEYFVAWISAKQYEWMILANQLLEEGHQTPVNGFVHPALSATIQGVRVVGPAHFQAFASTEKLVTPLSPAGIVGTVQLEQLSRMQYLEVADHG